MKFWVTTVCIGNGEWLIGTFPDYWPPPPTLHQGELPKQQKSELPFSHSASSTEKNRVLMWINCRMWIDFGLIGLKVF